MNKVSLTDEQSVNKFQIHQCLEYYKGSPSVEIECAKWLGCNFITYTRITSNGTQKAHNSV